MTRWTSRHKLTSIVVVVVVMNDLASGMMLLEGYPTLQPTKFTTGIRDRAPAENDFAAFFILLHETTP